MSEFSQNVPELVAWARKNDFSLSLPIDRLAFVLAIATLNSERMDGEMSEEELVDVFRYVSEGFEQTQETVTVRANNGINDLVRQDILPKALCDPGYLPRNDFTILSGWSSDAAVIDPTSIDWNMVTPNHFPYRLQQAPGPKNALGRYKFNMPSSDAIYLHDTPNHNLFGQDSVRA